MKTRYTTIILTVIAVNLTVLTTIGLVDQFVPKAFAASTPVQKIAICDPLGIKCADISNLVRGSLLVKEGQ
jgi:hypothetical protein